MQSTPLLVVHAVLAVLLVACSGETASSGIAGPASSSGADTDSGSGGSSGSSGAPDGATEAGASSGSSGGMPGSLVPGTSTRSFMVAGRMRVVTLVVPQQALSRKVPLIVALHGNGDTSTSFIATSGLEQLAGQRGFVLAAPQGIERALTIGPQTIEVDWDAYQSQAQGNIDLPLLDAIVDDLTASRSIDEKRISTYGYSQGGYLSFRYGVERSSALACSAVIAAANPLGAQLTATAARKIPFSMQIGTKDFGIGQARATRDDLEQKGFPLEYREIEGAGHVPFPGSKTAPLDDCLGRALP